MIRYTRPVKDFYVFLEAGISNGLALKSENLRTEESYFYQQFRVSTEDAIKAIRKHEQSVLFGAGVKYHRFSLAYRIEKSNGMSDMSQMKSPVLRQYLLIAYRLTGKGS